MGKNSEKIRVWFFGVADTEFNQTLFKGYLKVKETKKIKISQVCRVLDISSYLVGEESVI